MNGSRVGIKTANDIASRRPTINVSTRQLTVTTRRVTRQQTVRRRTIIKLITEPDVAAKAASLRYVSDAQPGISRRRTGKSFTYVGPDGRIIRDRETRERIRGLIIPPAWTDVWICTLPNGHLQATGRDARGRKQYRYHPRWTGIRDDTKYGRMIVFLSALPRIRRRVRRDLALPGVPKEKVLATVVRLLETTFLRIGNEEYAKQNGSYGLTTLRDRHAKIRGGTVELCFRGKSGIEHTVHVNDRRLARLIKQFQDLPGQELFQYLDETGAPQPIDSSDVNEYLRTISGEEFTAKDFRTWAGTMLAAAELCAAEPCTSVTATRRSVTHAVRAVASRLGNTVTVCRKCYIHPAIFEAYLEGSLTSHLQRTHPAMRGVERQLRAEEAALLRFLRRQHLSAKRA